MVSPSVEDYIKTIYAAQADMKNVTTQEVAARLHISPAAVSKMLKRLTELCLITHTPYHGMRLTETGEKMALEIIRHHRLLEVYLMQALGYSWDEVHQEAERLEHHISEEFEERIDALLGYPTNCPHGDPIPTREGVLTAPSDHPLAEQSPATHLRIRRVRDEDAEMLRHLKKLGLLPGTAIEFLDQEPFGGAYLVRVGDEIVRVAPQVARQIFVTTEA